MFIADVAEGVEIPGDGTLSKKLVEAPVRVVLFAFDEGQELTEHSTPRRVIIQVERGYLRIDVDGSTHEARPGSWLYMEPNEPHSVLAVEPSIMLLTMLPAE